MYRASITFKIEEGETEARIVLKFDEKVLARALDAFEVLSRNSDKDMDIYVRKVDE